MSKRIEVKAGQVFGSWTVLYETDSIIRKDGQKCRVLHCRCECGTKQDVRLPNLRSGTSTQCKACSIRETGEKRRIKIHIGDRFNSWEVLREPESIAVKNNHIVRMVYCKCKCGYKGYVALTKLNARASTQCKACARIGSEVKEGERFGHWKVINEAETKITKGGNKKRMIKCECKCGEIHEILLGNLTNGASTQCKKCSRIEQFQQYRKDRGLPQNEKISDINESERNLFGSVMRAKIFSRDNGECQMCYKPSENVHHIIPWSDCYKTEDQQLRYDPENCIALCKDCHLKAHAGSYKKLDDKIAEQLLAKAIENTEKNFEYMKGLKEEALKKLAEIH